ncbi:MAG TPA: hypothetical protein VHY08_08020 [Bacillota bacterium]|nr:hypothetical protein [Bacillota bacterium]
MIRKQRWLLICLVLVVALVFAGCGQASLTDRQKITNAFKAIDLSNILQGSDVHQSSLSSKTTVGSKSWDGTAYSDIQYSSEITNVVITGDTATATGSFTFSGTYTCSGTYLTTPWTYSKSFSASGQGTVDFVKVDGEWRVSAIEDMLLKCSNAGNQAPDIAPINFTPSKDIAAGENITLSTTVTSNLSVGSTNLGFLVVTRGFILGVNNNIQWNNTDNPYPYTTTINTNTLNYIGNHYGAIVAYQLVGNPGGGDAFAIYFSIRITMFKIHEAGV